MTMMSAEILFLNAEHLAEGIVVLRDLGFKIEVMDLVHEYEGERITDSVWLMCRIESALSGLQFFNWVKKLPHGGDVIEAGAPSPVGVPRSSRATRSMYVRTATAMSG